jgi:hypothetical protein
MTTDTTLTAWKNWLNYSIFKELNSPLSSILIQLRDSEGLKSYPGIYISEASADRVEAGGIMDGNAWEIEIQTQLVTTPGDDDQAASSKAAHDVLRNALSPHIAGCMAENYLNSQVRLTCFDLQSSSPVTTDEEGYRVTTWKSVAVVCVD